MSSSSNVPLIPMSPTNDCEISSPSDQNKPLRMMKTANGGKNIAARPPFFDNSFANRLYRRHSTNTEDSPYSPRPTTVEEEQAGLIPLSATKSSPPRECILPISQLPVESQTRQRLVSKEGNFNVQLGDASHAEKLFVDFFDLYTTFLEMRWGSLIALICSSLIFSWAFFALCWYILITYRGDIGYRSRPKPINNVTGLEEAYIPCVNEVDSYVTAFLYTLEGQTTIGFGSRNPTDRCPESVFLLVLQTVMAVCQAGTIGAIMAGKFIKPSRRKQALKLSKYACLDSTSFSLGSELILRMYDMRRKSRIIVQNVYGVLVRQGTNPKTGAPTLTSCEVSFKASYGMGSGNILLTVFPVTLVHEVDDSSPFYGMKESDFAEGTFELIVAVDGMMEVNGLAFRKLSSYLPDEIKLGYAFEDFYGSLAGGRLSVNFNKLESIKPMSLYTSKSL